MGSHWGSLHAIHLLHIGSHAYATCMQATAGNRQLPYLALNFSGFPPGLLATRPSLHSQLPGCCLPVSPAHMQPLSLH